VAQRSVLVLDEPSTGLAATDVEHLARCLGRLVRRGNAVVVIEHHTELLEVCDRLVELGPEGGEAGGQVIGEGTPRELAADRGSVTGRWLFQAQARAGRGRGAGKGSGKTAGKARAGAKAAARKSPAKGRAKGAAKATSARTRRATS